MPPVVGAVAGVLGLWIMPVFLVIFVVGMTIMIEFTYRKTKERV